MRKTEATTRKALVEAIGTGISSVIDEDARGFFELTTAAPGSTIMTNPIGEGYYFVCDVAFRAWPLLRESGHNTILYILC